MISWVIHSLVSWEESKREIRRTAREQLAQYYLLSYLSYSKWRLSYRCNYMFKGHETHNCYTGISRKHPIDTEMLNSGALIEPKKIKPATNQLTGISQLL